MENNVSFNPLKMIEDKDCSVYDLYQHLMKHKGKSYTNPKEIVSTTGLNLLHIIVETGRLSLFPVIIAMGWWKTLSEQKVPEDSASISYRGCLPKDIADKNKSRKIVTEFEEYVQWEDSITPLMKASRSGDIAKVKNILQNNTNTTEIFGVDFKGWNALSWAVVNGNEEIFQLLLQTGLDIKIKSKKEETLLHIACLYGRNNLVEILTIKNGQLDPFLNDFNNKSAYDRVAENGDVETLKILDNFGYKPNSLFVVLAAFNGRYDCLVYCLNTLKMDINSTDVYERTALHRSLENKKEKVFRYLCDQGAEVKAVTCSQRNILHIAADSGSLVLMKLCIAKLEEENELVNMINAQDSYNGVELCFLVRGRDKGRDAWHYVEVHRQLVPLFLRKTKAGNVDVMTFGKVIISGWGVNPDQENIKHIEEMFKKRRLNKSAVKDMTPLAIAVFKGHSEIVQFLLEKGAQPNIKDKSGLSPLMIAASQGNLDIFSMLTKAKAMLQDCTTDGQTILDIAKKNEQDQIITYLRGMPIPERVQDFATVKLAHYRDLLKKEKLDKVRSDGTDVRKHVIDLLRDLNLDINQYLAEFGSGPVLEATD